METLDFTLPNVEKGAWGDFVIVTFPVKFICSIVAKTVFHGRYSSPNFLHLNIKIRTDRLQKSSIGPILPRTVVCICSCRLMLS